MKNNMFKTVIIIMVAIFVVFAVGIVALVSISKNKKAGNDTAQISETVETPETSEGSETEVAVKETATKTDKTEEPLPVIEQPTTTPSKEEAATEEETQVIGTGREIGVVTEGNPEDITISDFKYKTDDISEIYVYSKAPDNLLENCWFKLQLEDGVLYYSCYYLTEDARYVADRQVINNARLSEVFAVINRYTMVDSINDYRKGLHVNKVAFEPEEGSKVEAKGVRIGWTDGDSFDFGYPNGAGRALIKYFKDITVWICESTEE